MSHGNYPPGVSGNEPQIAGWDEYAVQCEDCGRECIGYGQFHNGRGYASGTFNYDCNCGMSGTIEVVLEPDEDYGRDR